MVFDACHSGATQNKSGARGVSADSAAFIDQQRNGRMILSSCGLNEVAYDDDQSKHGVFTRYLLEGLKMALIRMPMGWSQLLKSPYLPATKVRPLTLLGEYGF